MKSPVGMNHKYEEYLLAYFGKVLDVPNTDVLLLTILRFLKES
jgi:hypothetical protein